MTEFIAYAVIVMLATIITWHFWKVLEEIGKSIYEIVKKIKEKKAKKKK